MRRRTILDLALHRHAAARPGRARPGDTVEQIDRGLAGGHARGDLVGMLLVAIADLADATLDADPGAPNASAPIAPAPWAAAPSVCALTFENILLIGLDPTPSPVSS